MLNSVVLETAIALVFVYLLLSLICTAVNEWIAQLARLRARTLKKAVECMLPGKAATEFYQHPLIKGLTENVTVGPAYIPSGTFATAVRGIITGNTVQRNVDDLRAAIEGLPNGDMKESLKAVLQDGTLSLEQAQLRIENWFNEVMQRVTGWYKRRLRYITLAVAGVVTIALNVDTLRIAEVVAKDTDLRLKLVAAAEQRTGQGAQGGTAPVTAAERNYLERLGGWKAGEAEQIPARIPGWILTMLAVSLGAPFWFDVLNRAMTLRSAGRAPGEAKS
ncbi:MAG: hypothetical protein SFV54_19925 [Bryobacteraceae bacterium]|nr:hypothetical protein [Bryobacteraceae bacterium]